MKNKYTNTPSLQAAWDRRIYYQEVERRLVEIPHLFKKRNRRTSSLLTSDYHLINTNFIFSPPVFSLNKCRDWWKYHPYSPERLSFEEVLDSVPEDLQTELMYHLDIFI